MKTPLPLLTRFRHSRFNTPSATIPYAGPLANAPQSTWPPRIPWHIAMLVRLKRVWEESYHIVYISVVEIRNLPRRIRIQLREIRSLSLGRIGGTAVVPDHPCLSTWKPSRSECTRQVMAQTPWVSLYDLSLCLRGSEAAFESLHRHIQDSGMEHICTQKSDSHNSSLASPSEHES
jgi:hypothetical protein